jgi:hypothetical protein
MEHQHRAEAPLSAVPAALHRALGVLLTPLVIGAGLLASRGGSGGVWGLAVLLAVLAGAAVVVMAGVRAEVGRARQRRRSTATTLPSTVASSPGIGS